MFGPLRQLVWPNAPIAYGTTTINLKNTNYKNDGSNDNYDGNFDDNDDKNDQKTYKYKDVASRGTKTVFGFIAQQIDTVLPEAVSKLNDVIPNTYELCDATSSSNNDYYDTITFTNFNTANLDTSSNNLVLVDANNKNHSVNITAVLDSSSVQVDTDLLEWMGAVDASNETVIANEVQTYEKVILDASNNVVLENYDITTIASMDASENVVGKMADLRNYPGSLLNCVARVTNVPNFTLKTTRKALDAKIQQDENLKPYYTSLQTRKSFLITHEMMITY